MDHEPNLIRTTRITATEQESAERYMQNSKHRRIMTVTGTSVSSNGKTLGSSDWLKVFKQHIKARFSYELRALCCFISLLCFHSAKCSILSLLLLCLKHSLSLWDPQKDMESVAKVRDASWSCYPRDPMLDQRKATDGWMDGFKCFVNQRKQSFLSVISDNLQVLMYLCLFGRGEFLGFSFIVWKQFRANTY
ncbi:hypothetical protein AMECASPLE_001789 [Ameca splendens]|uniref:Uncharacterized protein n=1 Tax=Ameca splendens TaxID=208324 RepID=A0ABV0YWP1_9TELE